MDWKTFLEEVSLTLIRSNDLLDRFLIDNTSNWLGFTATDDHAIQLHESRLGISLPPSYKEFLKASNGFKQLSCFIWDILPVDKIDWLKKFDPHLHDLYTNQFKDDEALPDHEYFVYGEEQNTAYFRSEYLVKSLAVSDWGDSAILLLNPEVKFGDEWEAWMYATWHPGAVRYKSFEELMKEEYSSYLSLLNEED